MNKVNMNKKSKLAYFTKFELTLLCSSILLILVSFLIFDRQNYLNLIASLLGVISLIFCAKGNPIGEALIITFSVFYGIISYAAAYYGEMITYLGMTTPMAIFALISWLRNPYNGNHSEVKVNTLKPKEFLFLFFLTIAVTVAFYFILDALGTANLLVSTLSVSTSFAAVYLTARRSHYFTVAYALNDLVLIVLWIFQTLSDISAISMVVCFVVFLANDIYGFTNWQKMKRRQGNF